MSFLFLHHISLLFLFTDYFLSSSYHCCGYLPNDAIEAVNECISSNFDLAIASVSSVVPSMCTTVFSVDGLCTHFLVPFFSFCFSFQANTHWQFVRSFLRDKIPQFTGLLYTEAVQTGQSWKTSSLSKVLGHYNMTNASECSVFFDDLWENKKFADGLGIPFVKVSPSSGVTTGNVKNGIGLVREKCPCRFN